MIDPPRVVDLLEDRAFFPAVQLSLFLPGTLVVFGLFWGAVIQWIADFYLFSAFIGSCGGREWLLDMFMEILLLGIIYSKIVYSIGWLVKGVVSILLVFISDRTVAFSSDESLIG